MANNQQQRMYTIREVSDIAEKVEECTRLVCEYFTTCDRYRADNYISMLQQYPSIPAISGLIEKLEFKKKHIQETATESTAKESDDDFIPRLRRQEYAIALWHITQLREEESRKRKEAFMKWGEDSYNFCCDYSTSEIMPRWEKSDYYLLFKQIAERFL